MDVEHLLSKKMATKKFYFASLMEKINGVPGMIDVLLSILNIT